MRRTGEWLLMCLLMAGCASETGTVGPRQSGEVPVTPRALAAVAAQYTPQPDAAQDGADPGRLGKATLAADLLYQSTEQSSGNRLTVAVGSDLGRMFTECADFLDGCEPVEGGLLFWQEEEPEEDPGSSSRWS